MTYQEVYAPPFHVVFDMYTKSSNGTTTFTAFTEEAQSHMKRIVGILNGGIDGKYQKDVIKVHSDKIFVGEHLILVRGWGRLVGHGICGLGLSITEATAIQNEFIKWVVDKITKD